MFKMSQPLSAKTAQNYHAEEFANAASQYYSEAGQVAGQWFGKFAEEMGLAGAVRAEDFAKLSEGVNPQTGAQMVRHKGETTYLPDGQFIVEETHRAGWDGNVAPPKSVSLEAILSRNHDVLEAARASMMVTAHELERFIDAHPTARTTERTERSAVAIFEHTSSRPTEVEIDGLKVDFSAPQLHHHLVVMNATRAESGKTYALEPKELFKSQHYLTSVHHNDLAWRLRQAGYELTRGEHGAFEIAGYSKETIEAFSGRSKEIEAHLKANGLSGQEAQAVAALSTRQDKQNVTPEELYRTSQAVAALHGNEHLHVYAEAQRRLAEGIRMNDGGAELQAAHKSLTYAMDHALEREAVVGERRLMSLALDQSQGEARLGAINQALEEKILREGFVVLESTKNGREFTTREMQRIEERNIAGMKAGQGTYERIGSERAVTGKLSESQAAAVKEVLASQDKYTALAGAAGTGKTQVLTSISRAAERNGYQVHGMAATGLATKELSRVVESTSTLQKFLESTDKAPGKNLYVVDESSLVGSRQLSRLMERIGEKDRVLLVGDPRQFQSIEAGKPYEQLIAAGMRTASLSELRRQQDPDLKRAVAHAYAHDIGEAMKILDDKKWIHEVRDRDNRLDRAAHDFAQSPERAILISPDNDARIKLNAQVHELMRENGKLSGPDRAVEILIPRQDLTKVQKRSAETYKAGDVVKFVRGSKALDAAPGERAEVVRVDPEGNRLTVALRESGQRVKLDPGKVTLEVYHTETRRFAEGERVQFTTAYRPPREEPAKGEKRDVKEKREQKEKGQAVPNRTLGTISKLDSRGNITIQLDAEKSQKKERTVTLNVKEFPHIEPGYAVTSFSAQGQSARRAIIYAPVEEGHTRGSLNQRFAYTTISRSELEVKVYTDDLGKLTKELSHDVSKRSALEVGPQKLTPAVSQAKAPSVRPAATVAVKAPSVGLGMVVSA